MCNPQWRYAPRQRGPGPIAAFIHIRIIIFLHAALFNSNWSYRIKKKQPIVIGAIVFSRDRVKDTSSLGPYELLVETPQGMALNQQAAISIDTGAFIPLQWQTCVGRVCIAQLNSLSDSLLEQFSHGKTGHIRMTSLRGSVLSISFELNGVSHAFDTINNWIK